MTQAALAWRIGVSESTVSGWECGTEPTGRGGGKLKRLLRFLGSDDRLHRLKR